MTVIVSAFYKFVAIDDTRDLIARLREEMAARAMKGTLLVAPEGINGTVSAAAADMAAFHAILRADPRFADLATKDAMADVHPFQRLKVRLKREIITLRRPEADPSRRVGVYVPPRDWNALIQDPDVILLDTRNAYEVAAGTFAGAVDPGIAHFTHWPNAVAATLAGAERRKIAMFCTGGIRCEKASAYLLAHGFESVYHLEGGILAYLAEMPPEKSLWQGTCFVFDARETVDGSTALPGGATHAVCPTSLAGTPEGETP